MDTGEFPRTTWGVLRALRPGDEGYRLGFETLCDRYRRAIRRYAAAAWARDEHEADDLTQEFFLWLMSGGVLEQYASERGSFRNYLKGLLRNFGRNFRRAARRRVKREGAASLEDSEVADPRAGEAERAFDREFVGEVTKRALASLQLRLSRGEKAVQWHCFAGYDLKPEDERPTYGALAAQHGIPESAVRNYLHRVRSLLRDQLRVELSETVATKDELEDEWRQFSS